MSEEILYTSAQQGLRPGSRGFCTVASTAGMASTLAVLLESLSGYRHLSAPGDSSSGANPTNYQHVKAVAGGKSLHILSRIGDAGHDYSGRSNKVAHHVALTSGETNESGPAAIQQAEGFHETKWKGEPRLFRSGRALPEISVEGSPCTYWQQVAGDAGWGGVIGQRLAGSANQGLWLIVPPDVDALGLLRESLAIMPPAMRWQVTYSTFFTKLPPGIECLLRCVVDGTPEAALARKRYDLGAIDLCRPLPAPPGGAWTTAARTGQSPDASPSATTPPPAPVAEELAAASFDSGEIELEDLPEEVNLAQVAAESPPPLPARGRRQGKGRYIRSANSERSEKKSSWLLAGACMAVLLAVVGIGVIWAFNLPGMVGWRTDTAKAIGTGVPDSGPSQPSVANDQKRPDAREEQFDTHHAGGLDTLDTSPDDNKGTGSRQSGSAKNTPADESAERSMDVSPGEGIATEGSVKPRDHVTSDEDRTPGDEGRSQDDVASEDGGLPDEGESEISHSKKERAYIFPLSRTDIVHALQSTDVHASIELPATHVVSNACFYVPASVHSDGLLTVQRDDSDSEWTLANSTSQSLLIVTAQDESIGLKFHKRLRSPNLRDPVEWSCLAITTTTKGAGDSQSLVICFRDIEKASAIHIPASIAEWRDGEPRIELPSKDHTPRLEHSGLEVTIFSSAVPNAPHTMIAGDHKDTEVPLLPSNSHDMRFQITSDEMDWQWRWRVNDVTSIAGNQAKELVALCERITSIEKQLEIGQQDTNTVQDRLKRLNEQVEQASKKKPSSDKVSKLKQDIELLKQDLNQLGYDYGPFIPRKVEAFLQEHHEKRMHYEVQYRAVLAAGQSPPEGFAKELYIPYLRTDPAKENATILEVKEQ